MHFNGFVHCRQLMLFQRIFQTTECINRECRSRSHFRKVQVDL